MNMEKMDSIIDALCSHEITKNEAKDRLLLLCRLDGNNQDAKEALNAAVSAVYFDDSSDYRPALFQVVRHLTGITNAACTVNIDKLFSELNPKS